MGDKPAMEMDFNAIVKLAEIATKPKEAAATNADSFTDMLSEVTKGMDYVLQLANKADTICDVLDKRGLMPLLVRGAGAKLGVDAETPLKSSNAIIPTSPTHKAVMDNINHLSPEELQDFGRVYNEIMIRKQNVNKPAPEADKPAETKAESGEDGRPQENKP